MEGGVLPWHGRAHPPESVAGLAPQVPAGFTENKFSFTMGSVWRQIGRICECESPAGSALGLQQEMGPGSCCECM